MTCWIDAFETAMIPYVEDGAGACQTFFSRAGLTTDSTLKE